MSKIYDVVAKLKAAGIYFHMSSHRDDVILLVASVPGQRWEIEVFSDQSVEIEIFASTGNIENEKTFDTLISQFTD